MGRPKGREEPAYLPQAHAAGGQPRGRRRAREERGVGQMAAYAGLHTLHGP